MFPVQAFTAWKMRKVSLESDFVNTGRQVLGALWATYWTLALMMVSNVALWCAQNNLFWKPAYRQWVLSNFESCGEGGLLFERVRKGIHGFRVLSWACGMAK